MKLDRMKLMLAAGWMTALVLLYACNGAENKADTSPVELPVEKNNTDRASSAPRSTDTSSRQLAGDPNDILSNIDKYLLSEARYQPGTPAGIMNGTVTVKNTLADIIIEKAILEVSILKETGEEYRTDYHIITNLDPGTAKTVKLANSAQGSKVVSHIVKLRSDALTAGETVLVGSRYVPK